MSIPVRLSALPIVLAAALLFNPWTAVSIKAQDSKPQTEEAQSAAANDEDEPEEAPDFTEVYLKDPAHIATGQEIWQDQCRHCHGSSAYPGKAPKLKPRRYKPDFVFDRVTNGFRKMPAWKDAYSREERMAVVAWVLSKQFSP